MGCTLVLDPSQVGDKFTLALATSLFKDNKKLDKYDAVRDANSPHSCDMLANAAHAVSFHFP